MKSLPAKIVARIVHPITLRWASYAYGKTINSARMLASGGAGKSPKRMKDLETALTKSLETCFAMAEERGLFAGDTKSRTVNDIVEDIKMTKKQMADLKAMEEDSIFSDDSDEEDGDGDSDGEGMNTYELAIASLKKRLKELKSELKNHNK